MVLNSNNLSIAVDFKKAAITSIIINEKERLATPSALFSIRLRDKEGNPIIVTSYDAQSCIETDGRATYTNFSSANISVCVCLSNENGEAAWHISVKPENDKLFVEYVDFPSVTLPSLKDNNTCGAGGKILFPYNEGVLISDINMRENSFLRYEEPEYPSKGSFGMFPNMICSQMLAYLWNDCGLYIGAHDTKRGVKDINFYKAVEGVTLRFRLFCGTDFGETFTNDYPIIFSVTDGKWESAAERYRRWFEENLPKKAKKISDNDALPEWYEDSPLVITYPVRGIHDMDEMKPNKLYPYTNALPILDEIRDAVNNRLLVLLMHWEGTAPWAPPYVWPPFGGTENFNAFMQKLHEKRDLLGVYCSGFGYTKQSNLIESYNNEAEYAEKELWRGMCAAPDGKVYISNICQGQRSGYDICPASEVGRAILKEAYSPLFENGLDYVQILDQNHGGGQYFCYSREHGHAPGPGAWMTENMQDMLSEWNDAAGKTLFGCESAAAEPFIGNLLFSDNRYELNHALGTPVPLYAYIYHEYVRNFMGNQVCCMFPTQEDTLRYRLAYSFSIGDCMTLVLTQEGKLMTHWGTRDFENCPDKEKALRLISNLSLTYKNSAKRYLYSGRMIPSPEVKCKTAAFYIAETKSTLNLPTILSSAWEADDGSRALILVNPYETDIKCTVNNTEFNVPALNALVVDM